MAVKTDYISKRGKAYSIGKYHTLGEMQCKNGADKVLWSPPLIERLTQLREGLNADALVIYSGYRTEAYNTSKGGSKGSYHCKGMAADIYLLKDGKKIPCIVVCCYAQDLGIPGIAICRGSGTNTHIDVRTSGTFRCDERINYSNNIGGDFYSYAAKKYGLSKTEIQSYFTESEDDEMDQERFNKMADTYFAAKAKEAPAKWSADAREFVEDNNIFNGDANGDFHYKSPCTREELAQVLYGMASYFETNGSDKALVDAIKAISVPLEAMAQSKEED